MPSTILILSPASYSYSMRDLASCDALHSVCHDPSVRVCIAWLGLACLGLPCTIDGTMVPVPYTLIYANMTPGSLGEQSSNNISRMTIRGMGDVVQRIRQAEAWIWHKRCGKMPWWCTFMMAVMVMIAKTNITKFFGYANMHV